jgi:hypothetical protein
MSVDFEEATKEAQKARIALTGPAGSGKTFTALMLAHGLGENIAVIDTERGKASLYVGRNGWRFKTIKPTSYSPLSLVEHLGKAEGAGFDVVIIDSLSHYWEGIDGMLEQVDKRSGASKFTSGWKVVRPEERRMIDAILAYPGHVIITLRSKQEYVLETNDRGKQEPKRVGLKPVQRDGIEYEFDLIGDMDLTNTLTVSKSRIEGVETGTTFEKPSMELAATVAAFLADGTQIPSVSEYRTRALELDSVDDLRKLWAEVSSHQLDGAPMLDENGHPTILGDFISYRASQVKMRNPEAGS